MHESNVDSAVSVRLRSGQPSRQAWHSVALPIAALLLAASVAVGGADVAHAAAASAYSVTDCSQYGQSGDAGGTLYDALATADANSGSTVQFACSGGSSATYSIFVPSPIAVGNNLTMDGNGFNVTLDGSSRFGNVQLFVVNAASSLTLDSLSITNHSVPSSSPGGGAIENVGGTVTIANCTFTNNSVPYQPGGAILSEGGTLTIANSTFNGNSSWAGGGAIANEGGTLTVTNSNFTGNTTGVPGDGGAVLNTQNASATITNGDVFSSNTTSEAGGAIANEMGSTLVVANARFSDNVSGLHAPGSPDGGAIYNVATATVTNSSIVHNTGGSGGGIANEDQTSNGTTYRGKLTVSESTISLNVAGNDGAGIVNSGGTLTITDTTISGNSSTNTYNGAGSGIYNGNDSTYNGAVTISDSTISANTAALGGGIANGKGILDVGGTLYVTNSTISGNVATGGGGGNGGGGIETYNGTVRMTDSTVVANAAAGSGAVGGGFLSWGFAYGSGTYALGGDLIALNTPGGDCAHATTGEVFTDLGYNLDSDNICGLTAANHDQPGVTSPDLGTLESNGGPTQTVALLAGSPAVDAITVGATYTDNTSACPASGTTDERGISRPQGVGCDLGAFELAGGPPPPPGGSVSGKVHLNSASGPSVPNAPVQACPSDNLCVVTLTDTNGNFTFNGLKDGSYTLTAFAPAGEPYSKGAAGPINIVGGDSYVGADIVEINPTAPPSGTTISGGVGTYDNGIPIVYWQSPFTLTTPGCAGGTANYQVQVLGSVVSSGPLSLTGTDLFTAILPPLAPSHGFSIVVLYVSCPGQPTQTFGFGLYIDPSGTVVDQNGNPVAGATMTLFRQDDTGNWVQVPNGSAIMDPFNRNNPDTTDSAGHYGWDVLAGTYKIRAAKTGCWDPNNPSNAYVESGLLTVPPAITGLTLTLTCDTQPPAASFTRVSVNGVAAVQVTLTDPSPSSGLKEIDVYGTNLQLVDPTTGQLITPSGWSSATLPSSYAPLVVFTDGTHTTYTFTAEKVDTSQSAFISVEATDQAGNVGDPPFTLHGKGLHGTLGKHGKHQHTVDVTID